MIYSNERGSVIDAHFEYLTKCFGRYKYIRIINYRFPSMPMIGSSFGDISGKINILANKREDDLNKKLNELEDIKLIDKLYHV